MKEIGIESRTLKSAKCDFLVFWHFLFRVVAPERRVHLPLIEQVKYYVEYISDLLIWIKRESYNEKNEQIWIKMNWNYQMKWFIRLKVGIQTHVGKTNTKNRYTSHLLEKKNKNKHKINKNAFRKLCNWSSQRTWR